MRRGRLFELADHISAAELDSLHITNKLQRLRWRGHVRAKSTGEFRAPRRGEWYISGSAPQAWRAFNDLETAYNIAVLVHVETVTREIIREVQS